MAGNAAGREFADWIDGVGAALRAFRQITVDEQAALYFSVLDSNGNQLLLTQRGSKIGGAVEGPQVKTIHYVMLVPRTIPVRIRVPANLLQRIGPGRC